MSEIYFIIILVLGCFFYYKYLCDKIPKISYWKSFDSIVKIEIIDNSLIHTENQNSINLKFSMDIFGKLCINKTTNYNFKDSSNLVITKDSSVENYTSINEKEYTMEKEKKSGLCTTVLNVSFWKRIDNSKSKFTIDTTNKTIKMEGKFENKSFSLEPIKYTMNNCIMILEKTNEVFDFSEIGKLKTKTGKVDAVKITEEEYNL